MSRLGARCLSAVSAYDNTLEIVDTLDTAQAKFDDILNSPSVDVACEKIQSLAKGKELDSSLILLINAAWASAKESTTMKNEVWFATFYCQHSFAIFYFFPLQLMCFLASKLFSSLIFEVYYSITLVAL